MKLEWKKYTLIFKNPSGTSRGVLKTKDSYFLKIVNGGKTGIGECGLLKGLSVDDRPDYEQKLDWLAEHVDRPLDWLLGQLIEFPSIQFGLEIAMADLHTDEHVLFESDFTRGEVGQAINGLIWMGDTAFMNRQVAQRLEQGFKVLKMKVGAIGFEEEYKILKGLRSDFSASDLEIRVDANGAFSFDEAPSKLERLAALQIHSIEQPIAKGQWTEMASLCSESPIPIALDEELIGLFTEAERRKMLNEVKPQYIILKPSLIGGFANSEQWIKLANEVDADWWVTSALESNVGLSAIAQWNYLQSNPMPSGLGTGSLYTNNLPSPLEVKQGRIWYRSEAPWKLEELF